MDIVELWDKLIKRILLVVLGVLFFVAGSWLLLEGVSIPGLGMPYELGGAPYIFDFTVVIYALLMGNGGAMIAIGLKVSQQPKYVFNSFPYSRFIAGIMLFSFSMVMLFIYGADFGGDNPMGAWLFLGGLPLFYPTSLVPFLFGQILIIVALFQYRKVSFLKKDGKLIIHETGPKPMVTEILYDDIEYARLTNARTGPKLLWMIPFIISMAYLYIDGFTFLILPSTYSIPDSYGMLTATTYLASATIQLAAMLLILLHPHHFIEIITKENLYELHIAPANIRSLQKLKLSFILRPSALRRDVKELENDGKIEYKKVKQPTNLKPLFFGLIFIFLGIISRLAHFWAGEALRYVLVIVGLVLVMNGIKNDLKLFSSHLKVRERVNGKSYMILGRGKQYKTEYYLPEVRGVDFSDPNFMENNAITSLKKLTLTDHLVATSIPFLIGLQTTPIFIMMPFGEGFLFVLPRFFLGLAVFACIALYFLDPKKVFKVKFGDRNLQIPLQRAKDTSIPGLVKNFVQKFKLVWQEHKRNIILRLVEIAVAFALGMIFAGVLFL